MNLGFVKSKDIKKYSLILGTFILSGAFASNFNSYAESNANVYTEKNILHKKSIQNIENYKDSLYKKSMYEKRSVARDRYNKLAGGYLPDGVTDVSNVLAAKEYSVNGMYQSYPIIDTSDGGVLIRGYTEEYDCKLIKVNKSDEVEWMKDTFSADFDSGVELSDGSFILVGTYSESFPDVDDCKGKWDAIIAKYDKDGNNLWVDNISGSQEDSFTSIIANDNGGVIAVGYSNSSDHGLFTHKGNYDGFIIKYDSDGNQIFLKTLQGSSRDQLHDIKRTSDGGFVVAGYSYSSDLGPSASGKDDFLIAKYDKSGNQEWIQKWGGNDFEFAYNVLETSDKGFIVSGRCDSSNVGIDNPYGSNFGVIVKFDKNGNFLWVSECELFSELGYTIETYDKGLLAINSYGSGFVKYNKEGEVEWVKFIMSNQKRIISVKEISPGKYVFDGAKATDAHYSCNPAKFYYQEKYDDYLELGSDIADILQAEANNETESIFYSGIETSDGGFVAVGTTTHENMISGYMGAIIAKYSQDGTQEWVKSFSEYDYYFSQFGSVVETIDGGFVSVGVGMSIDMESYTEELDAILVKYSKDGTQEWVKRLSGPTEDSLCSVVGTLDGGFIAAGYSDSTDAGFVNNGNGDGIVIKYSENGTQEWIRNFGGSDFDCFYFIRETSDNGFIAIGESKSPDAGFENKGDYDAVIVKYNSEGVQQWVKSFGGSGYDCFSEVKETTDGGFVVVGNSNSADAGFTNKGGYADAIVVKYNKNGTQEWVKNFGGSEDDYAYSVVETPDSGIIVTGDISYDGNLSDWGAVLVKYSKDGEEQWIKYFSENSAFDTLRAAKNTSDGGFVIFGGTYLNPEINSPYEEDALIVKLDSSLNKEFLNNVTFPKPKGVPVEEFDELRSQTNNIPHSELREYLNNKLNMMGVDLGTLELKTASANLDIYIKSENMLSLSLNTNSVSFENYSGVADVEMLGAVNLTVNSSLPYQINAYMPTEISNSDGSERMPIDVLNIKEGNETDYQTFESIADKVVLKDSCVKGNGNVHSIDLKLASNQAHKADIYKTVIKFEAEQK